MVGGCWVLAPDDVGRAATKDAALAAGGTALQRLKRDWGGGGTYAAVNAARPKSR